MNNEFNIPFPQYNTKITVVVVDDFEKVVKEYKLEYFDAENSFDAFVYYDSEDNSLPIYMFLRTETPMDIIVHECIHVTNRLLSHHGIVYTENEDEILAYYTQYIFRTVIKELMSIEYDLFIHE